MRKFLLWLFILIGTIPPNAVLAQKEGNIWYMGNSGANPCFVMGIDYNGGQADTFSMCREMDFFITNSSICDTAGQMLFYTNGYMIANREHDSIPGSKGFNPSLTNPEQEELNIAQGTLILNVPDEDSLYYIFHVNAEYILGGADAQPLELRYTIVDLKLDSGRGAVVANSLNSILLFDTLTLGRLTATKHANGKDWWLISHKYWSDEYLIFHVKKDTIIGPKRQHIGSVLKEDISGKAIFTPDGSWYSMIGWNRNLDIFKFDRCYGNFYDPQEINFHDSYGTIDSLVFVNGAFSANSKYLYAHETFYMYQFDLSADTIENSRIRIAEWDSLFEPFPTYFAQMQLTPLGSIHVGANGGNRRYHIIQYADSLGLACNFIQNQLLPQWNGQALPNIPNYVLDSLPQSYCDSIFLSNEHLEFEVGNNLLVYPVPSDNIVYFKLQDPSVQEVHFTLYDVSAKRVRSELFFRDDFFIYKNELKSGIYFYRIIVNSNEVYSGKLVFVE